MSFRQAGGNDPGRYDVDGLSALSAQLTIRLGRGRRRTFSSPGRRRRRRGGMADKTTASVLVLLLGGHIEGCSGRFDKVVVEADFRIWKNKIREHRNIKRKVFLKGQYFFGRRPNLNLNGKDRELSVTEKKRTKIDSK